jgi:hypothetical protein
MEARSLPIAAENSDLIFVNLMNNYFLKYFFSYNVDLVFLMYFKEKVLHYITA